MAEAPVEIGKTSQVGPGDPQVDIGTVRRLAQHLADQLLDVRGPPVHSIRLARAMTLKVVDLLEALEAGRRP